MRRRFRVTPAGKGPNDPWFNLGTLEVNTTMAIVLLSVFSFVLWAVEPVDKPVMNALLLDPQAVLQGQVWRLLTWPFAYPAISIWEVVTVFFFWYFGKELEEQLFGRVRFLKFFVWSTLALGGLLVLMYAAIPAFGVGVIWGLDTIQLMVLLLWIGEWPTRRFLFNVPAWLFGVVIVGISVLQYVGMREWWLLVHFLVGIGLCALIARHYGALTEHSWVPHFHLPHRQPRQKRSKRSKRPFDPSRPTVVSGPWEGITPEPRVTPDEARMNALLDKIHAHGQDSLSAKEKAELLELRERMRRR